MSCHPYLRPPGVAVTAGVMLAVGALTAVTLLGRSDDGTPWFWFGIAVGVVAVALLPVLLRRPVPAAVALAALAALSPAGTPAATVGTLLVAQRQTPLTAIGVGLVGTAAHAVQGLLYPIPGLPYGWFLVLDGVVHAALVASGAFARARRELLDSLRERAQRAEAEQAERIAAARSHERTVIAREMHDVLAHRLSLVAAYAGALEYRPDAQPAQVARAAGVVREGVHQALEELREVIGVLRADEPRGDHPQPVLAGLEDLVEETRAAGTDVTFDDAVTDATSAPETAGRAAYRIVQEALTNARKHAPGRPIHVRLCGGPGTGIEIDVSNALTAVVASTPGSGTGLAGLAERAALAGGRLEHGVTAAGEFRLHAALPWPR
ncbi:sensor histidine kinase [Pseudonocardia sp. GCM10023141]|uniref:sensor histidine kinase n=1 Tax=Pseudonocardia sp. GCM10023141 TaxID=3252653 RepID=UPI0036192D05